MTGSSVGPLLPAAVETAQRLGSRECTRDGRDMISSLTWMGSSHCSGEMISLFESVDKDGNGMLDEAWNPKFCCTLGLSASFESQRSINLPSSGAPNG